MDQLRKAWAWFVRYHFWVLTIVAIVLVAYFWNSGTSALEQEYAANKSKIEQSFSAISSVSNEPFKPNDEVKEKQQEQIDIQKKAVRSMWQQLYDRQRDNVLKWPENLSQEFRNFVGGLQFGAEIPIDLRNHYNTYVRDHFPNLPKIVGATLAPEGDVDNLIRVRTAQCPMGHMGTGWDTAHAVLFLASAEASFITGENLMVDGGYTAR